MGEEELEPCSKKTKLQIENNDEAMVTDSTITGVTSDIDFKEPVAVDTNSINTHEEKYGISLFINKSNRLSGIIKQRYSDFMVRECVTEENLVYLTNLKHCDDTLDVNEAVTTECPITDQILLQKVEEFVESEDKSKTFILDTDNDKEHRKLVHKYIKDMYKDIETDTAVQEDGSRAIKLSFKSNKLNKQHRRQPGWPKGLPKYCHFVLFKENRDTMECINILAKLVHTKASNFGYAGTKDRRATTIQRVSVQNVYSKQLSNINSKLRNMAVGNFSYNNTGIRLGDLSGNNFTITIRDLSESDEQVDLCCRSLQGQGFINYFGLQRFGTGAIPTHAIGKVLLESKFEEAVNMILQFNEHEEKVDRFQSAAKKIWHQTKDAKKALAAVSSRTSIEGKLLEHLSKQTGSSYNYYNAFMALPRNNRLMYLHSYQSLVWNNMVSKRIREFGNKPCVGDLILNKTKDEQGHPVVTTLTETDVTMETVNIYDIVLPLPGYDVVYPSNKVGQYYRDALLSDELDINNMKNKIKEISLPGTYRNMMVKPKDMSWQIQKYDDYKISLIRTDLEKLKTPEHVDEKLFDNLCVEGKHKAVTLQMTLLSSCYATSALREVLVTDSSYQSQVTLNEKFMSKNVCTENIMGTKE